MARIDIRSNGGGGSVAEGVLQLENGVAMDSTLRSVTDQNNTTSPLKLSTTAVQVNSPLRITTSDASGFYLDAEDSATNNRFSIKRDPSSQEVTLDFASNPAGSTTLVGAIRTYQDGVNLSNAMSFIEDGSVGIGTNAPVGILHLKTSAKNTRLAIDGDAGFNKLISYRTAGLQRFGLYVNNTAESGSNAGSNFAIRAYNDAGTLLHTPLSIERATGQVTFTERVNVEADSLVTTESCSVIAASTTNANLVIAPNGTGALIASIPDGTATGGNARGDDAVDLQTNRAAATNVASGNYSTISGGQSNTASIAHGTVSGGQSNTASTNSHATVVGGQSNVSSGQYSISGGVNNVASGSQTVAIGNGNIVQNLSQAYGFANNSGGNSCTAIGQQNTVTSNNSVGIGIQNIVSGEQAFAFGGLNNISVSYGFALGGNNSITGTNGYCLGKNNSTSSSYGVSIGFRASSYLYGQIAFANDGFLDQAGRSQNSTVIARKSDTLTTAGTTVLSLDGTGVTNLIIPPPNNRMWNVSVKTIAVVTAITGTATGVTVGDTYMQNNSILFKRRVSVGSTLVSVGTAEVLSDTSMITSLMTYTKGASEELGLTFNAPTFVGGGSLTIRVVSKVELIEVAY